VNPAAALADRNAAVRRAAWAWQKAGAIDEATLAAIEAAHPDDRARVGPVFRALLFVFTLVAISAAFGFIWAIVGTGVSEGDAFGALAVIFGIGLAVLTEVQTGALRRAQGGTEAATSFAALGYLLGALAWFLFEKGGLSYGTGAPIMFLAAAVLCAVAAWRWGFPLYAGASMAAVLMALVYAPGGRLLWIGLTLLAAPILLRLSDAERFPPAHRMGFTAALLVALAGLYFAVHLGSFDLGAIESLGDRSWLKPASGSRPLRWLSVAATALLPVILLVLGVRQRRRSLLLPGIVAAVASIVTFHVYRDLGPTWLLLTAWGAVAIAGALAVRRFLDARPGKEWHGLTAEPLFEDLEKEGLIETAAAVVTLAPEARPPREPGFAGGGGEFGGGGSSESF
jgi:MFS family permease